MGVGIYSLWIVGRNGGLLYSREFVQIPGIDFNDKLRLASSWFGMCRIASQLSPIPEGGGIKLLQADAFDLHSFHTLTGTTFMMVASPGLMDCAEILQSTVYELYCDFVMKNPFHETDQVIKSELFDTNLVAAIKGLNQKYSMM